MSAEAGSGLFLSDGSLGLRIQYAPSVLGSLTHRMKQSADLRYSNHGDLTATPPSALSSIAAHAYGASDYLDNVPQPLNFVVSDDGETAVAKLGERLELAVGGEGVIGKMVCVTSGGLELGDGVIGWN